jgi:hypothetical protein
MKKTILTIANFCVAMCVSAQVYVGGTLNYKSLDVPIGTNTKSATAFKFSPEVGYAINDTWSVGLGISYLSTDLLTTNNGSLGGYYDVTESSKLDQTFTSFAIYPYVRGNFYKSKIVTLFADGAFEYSNYKINNITLNAYGFALLPGIMVKLNETFSFVTRLGGIVYASAKADYDGAQRTNGFEFNLTSFDDLEFGIYLTF